MKEHYIKSMKAHQIKSMKARNIRVYKNYSKHSKYYSPFIQNIIKDNIEQVISSVTHLFQNIIYNMDKNIEQVIWYLGIVIVKA